MWDPYHIGLSLGATVANYVESGPPVYQKYIVSKADY